MTIRNNFMSQQIDTEKVAHILREVAAQYIMPRYKQLQSADISSKTSPNDLVTIADKEAEIALEDRLTRLIPGSVIVGEEGVSEGRASTKTLGEKGKVIWVVDPVDGTYNFVHGKAEFGMLLACVVDGEVTHGWLYDILGNRMMIAQKGKGVLLNGQRIQMGAPQEELAEMTGHAGLKYFPSAMRSNIKSFRKDVKALYTLSCACHEYYRLVTGQSDFAIYSNMRPWDHLAGTLAVREAGGYVAKWDGSAYGASDEFGGIVAAKSLSVWQKVHRGVIEKIVEDYKKEP